MKRYRRNSGFTLIEVVVALFILGPTLGSAIFVVHQYADERVRINHKVSASQVAWNSLLENHRYAEGWTTASERGGKPRQGSEKQQGRDWRWKVTIKPALGKDFYRYQADVVAEGSDRRASSLALYIVE
jgi:type II secretion system protein I